MNRKTSELMKTNNFTGENRAVLKRLTTLLNFTPIHNYSFTPSLTFLKNKQKSSSPPANVVVSKSSDILGRKGLSILPSPFISFHLLEHLLCNISFYIMCIKTVFITTLWGIYSYSHFIAVETGMEKLDNLPNITRIVSFFFSNCQWKLYVNFVLFLC